MMATTKTKPSAKKKGASIDMKEGAVRVLRRAHGPLHYREMWSRIAAEGKVVTKGATPAQSLSAKLATCAKRGDTFVKTAPGVYDLIERQEKQATASAEADAAAEADAS
jgi:HB1/ASXL restriction endonuclease-like protein with HTH domain